MIDQIDRVNVSPVDLEIFCVFKLYSSKTNKKNMTLSLLILVSFLSLSITTSKRVVLRPEDFGAETAA